MFIFNSFYKIVFNFYISKGEKDIPHIYSVCILSILELFNMMSLFMIIDMNKHIDFFNKLFVVELAIGVLVINFVLTYKYAKREATPFPVEKKMKNIFIAYGVTTVLVFFGIISLHQH